MKYKSNVTKQIKLSILFLILFWIVNFIAITNNNGYKDALVFSLFMLAFTVVFILTFVRGIYLVIENNEVKYVHMFLLRKNVEISKISTIKKAFMGGLYTSLSLGYEDNGKEKEMKIATLSFKNNTLKQFVSDLKNQKQSINVDPLISELFD